MSTFDTLDLEKSSLPTHGRRSSDRSQSRRRHLLGNDDDRSLVHSSTSTFVSHMGRSRGAQDGSAVSRARVDINNVLNRF